MPRSEPELTPVYEEPLYLNASREYDACSSPPLIYSKLARLHFFHGHLLPVSVRKQTAEALMEKPALPALQINPSKQAVPPPTPAPRKLAPAPSMPCISSSTDGSETRLRAQSDSRGQSRSSWPEQVGVKALSPSDRLLCPSVTMEALSELKLKLGQKAKAQE